MGNLGRREQTALQDYMEAKDHEAPQEIVGVRV
jgi:hypothetical protein